MKSSHVEEVTGKRKINSSNRATLDSYYIMHAGSYNYNRAHSGLLIMAERPSMSFDSHKNQKALVMHAGVYPSRQLRLSTFAVCPFHANHLKP